jgi:ABC-type oligopeptide transport system ATPase subunit
MLNFYELNDVKKLNTPSYNPHFKATQMNIPLRCGLIGASGSGKTNALMNYIKLTSGTFGEIHICYKTTEPLYELLDKKLKGKNIYFYTDVSKMPEPKDLKEKELYIQEIKRL